VLSADLHDADAATETAGSHHRVFRIIVEVLLGLMFITFGSIVGGIWWIRQNMHATLPQIDVAFIYLS